MAVLLRACRVLCSSHVSAPYLDGLRAHISLTTQDVCVCVWRGVLRVVALDSVWGKSVMDTIYSQTIYRGFGRR